MKASENMTYQEWKEKGKGTMSITDREKRHEAIAKNLDLLGRG